MKNRSWYSTAYTAIAVILSALLQAFVIKTFVQPANLLSGGFTGVAILIERITSLFGIHFSTSLGMIALNVPVAIICYKSIGKKFVFFSLAQVFLSAFFLSVCTFQPLFNEVLLNIAFGGFIYGLSIVIALRGNASTGGTDFIALYVSNRSGKSTWSQVFIFNCCILVIFGFIFGWVHAGHSILFQFISTQVVNTFHNRYKRVTLQATTAKPELVVNTYTANYRHGVSVLNGYGGYSKMPVSVLNTVVSSYEVQDIIKLMHSADPNIIINIMPSDNFVGRFYQKPLE